MNSPEEHSATTVVIEMGPGWIYVKIVEPKPEPERIELLLGLTIQQWFNAHPQFVIDKKLGLIEHGTLQGFNVWYHVGDDQPVPVNPESLEQMSSFAIESHDEIRKQLTLELIEAVVDEAMQIWRSDKLGDSTMVVITPRRIAVILDKQANRGAVVPVDFVYPRMEAASVARVQSWLEAPSTRLHLIQIPGSWFKPDKNEVRSKVVEPSFIPTNITYDTGSPPER